MKEKLIEWMKRSSQSMHYLRLIAGGYIVYLGWCNVMGYFRGETEDGLMIGLSVFLSVCGLLVAAVSFYALVRHLGTEQHKGFSLFGQPREAEAPEADESEEPSEVCGSESAADAEEDAPAADNEIED